MPAKPRKTTRSKAAKEDPPEEREPVRARARVPRGGRSNAQRETDPDTRVQKSVRLGKRWSQIIDEVKEGQYTWDEFCEELDPEELARGQLKDRHGNFTGRPPLLVPRAFQQACVKEIQRRFNEKVQARLLDAVDEMIDLSRAGGGLEGKDRAKLLVYLIERVMGPVPKQVVLQGADEPWQGMMAQGFVRPGVHPEQPTPPPPPRSDRYSKRRKRIDASEDVDD